MPRFHTPIRALIAHSHPLALSSLSRAHSLTGIERLKQDYIGHNRGWMFNLSETFGRPFSLLWLLPTTVKYNGLTWLDMLPQECEV